MSDIVIIALGFVLGEMTVFTILGLMANQEDDDDE